MDIIVPLRPEIKGALSWSPDRASQLQASTRRVHADDGADAAHCDVSGPPEPTAT